MYNLVVLCETNVLNLISQRLDNYYQIQTKCYSVATVNFDTPSLGTKHSHGQNRVDFLCFLKKYNAGDI
jgi:hypothetical protein